MQGINTTKFQIGEKVGVLRIFSSNVQNTEGIVNFVFECVVSVFISL